MLDDLLEMNDGLFLTALLIAIRFTFKLAIETADFEVGLDVEGLHGDVCKELVEGLLFLS